MKNVPIRGIPHHDPEACHKCQRGRHIKDITETEARQLCNELAADGWAVDYLSHRFHLSPKGGEHAGE